MKLQHDRQKGLLSEEQYNLALRELKFKKKTKRTRPTKLGKDEVARRKSLRTITKWVFDIELDRDQTPLYDDNKTLVLTEFLKLADQVIMYAGNDPVVASETSRESLVQTITALVINRRKNLKNSKKTSNPMKLIYHARKMLLITGADGKQQVVGPPKALPLTSTSRITTPATHTPAVKTPLSPPSSIVSTTAPPPHAQVTALPASTPPKVPPPPVPQSSPPTSTSTQPRITTPATHPPAVKTPLSSLSSIVSMTAPPPQATALVESTPPKVPPPPVPQSSPPTSTSTQPHPVTSPVPPSRVTTPESDDDFDILDLQQQLQDLEKKLTQAKTARKKKTHSWLTTTTTDINNSVVKTCRNSDCGCDFVVSSDDTEDQTFLCGKCWEEARDELQALTSSTGNPKKRKAKCNKPKETKKRKLVVKEAEVHKEKVPITPSDHQAVLQRTTTPPRITLKEKTKTKKSKKTMVSKFEVTV